MQLPLTTGLADDSALLRHEVAYCLGQRQDPASVQLLKDTLANPNEHPMYATAAVLVVVGVGVYEGVTLAYVTHRVRHEAAEALGAIATDDCLVPLKQHQHDPCLEVGVGGPRQACTPPLSNTSYTPHIMIIINTRRLQKHVSLHCNVLKQTDNGMMLMLQHLHMLMQTLLQHTDSSMIIMQGVVVVKLLRSTQKTPPHMVNNMMVNNMMVNMMGNNNNPSISV